MSLDVEIKQDLSDANARAVVMRPDTNEIYDFVARSWIAMPSSGPFPVNTLIPPLLIGFAGSRYKFIVPRKAVLTCKGGFVVELYLSLTPAVEDVADKDLTHRVERLRGSVG